MSRADPQVREPGSRLGRFGEEPVAAAERRSRLASADERRVLESGSRLLQLLLLGSLGVLVASGGLALSRSDPGSAGAEFLFWLGLLVVVLPVAYRLATVGPTRGERLALLIVLALLLYAVKIVHDPYGFVYSDEWVHSYNAQQIVRTGALFHPNTIIPVTARYPGLETVTAAVASIGGLGIFAAGAIVLVAARLVLVLALFLLFERLATSARVASIAALVYLTNPNFLFWTAQFSYESLALPLMVLAAFATVTLSTGSEPLRGREYVVWTVVACLASLATVATHHLTSYGLCVFMLAICAASCFRRASARRAPWLVTGVTVAATAAWVNFVAPGTGSYLIPVLRKAFRQTIDTIEGKTSGRALFETSGAHVQAASAWQRAIAVASVALVVLVLPFGLREIYRHYRSKPVVLVLGLAAALYVAVLPMRLIPAAWETSNRSSEFLYVGVALTMALAATLTRFTRREFPLAVTVAAGVLLVGGVVAGWPPRVLLSLPYKVDARGAVLPSQPLATAEWARGVLGTGRRFIAPEAIGRELNVNGGETAYVTDVSSFDAHAVLYADTVTASIVSTLAAERVGFVVIPRRTSSDDVMAGYFFAPRGAQHESVSRTAFLKYDVFPGVQRLLDTGNLYVYDVRSLWRAPS